MDTLLSVLAIWLSVNFGLPAGNPSPDIEFRPKATVSRFWAESVARQGAIDISVLVREIDNREIQAFYDDHHRVIFLADDWDPQSPPDVSVFIHELVHHLQNLDGRTYACPAEREKVAYAAQDAWLGLFGTSLEAQFEIDAMTLLVSTKCMH